MRMLLHKLMKCIAICIYRMMCLFPVKQDKIVFGSCLGKSFSGNPRYIFEYLYEHGASEKWNLIWFYEKKPFIIPGCRQAAYGELRYLYHMATAKIWIFDCRQPEFLIKRKGMYYIQTWHGTPLKKLALDLEHVFMAHVKNIASYKKKFAKNSNYWDFLISQNSFSSEVFRRAFAYDNEIWETGYPRNDVLIRDNNPHEIERKKVELGIPLNKKTILYAPTWRDDEFSKKSDYKFQPEISFDTLQKELGGEYILLIKHHYLIVDSKDWSSYEKFIYYFDESMDIAELYLIADMLVTDYSSVMFDYSVLRRPILFFAYDESRYKNDLRGFYLDYEKELPGPISGTTEKLIYDIKNYEPELYHEKYQDFIKKYNPFDEGGASERVCKYIEKLISSLVIADA